MYSPDRRRAWLDGGDRPLLRLCTWPFFDDDLLIESFLDAPDVERVAALDHAADAFDRGVRRVIVAAGEPSPQPRDRSEDLARILEHVPEGGRLVVLVRRIDDWGDLPARTVPPWEACLNGAELEALLGDRGAAIEARRLTEGWPGPARRLAGEEIAPESYESFLRGEAFRGLFDRRVLAGLDAPTEHALRELATAGPVDPDAWRQRVADDAERLGAFEGILRRRAWLVPDADGVRLPRLLAQRFEPEPADRERLRSELERARASDYRSVLGLGAAPSAEAPASAPWPPASSASDLRLELLGRPRLLRRTDGEPEEVAWRLKRSLRCLAYLALAPEQTSTKEALIDDLWPQHSPEAAQRNFHPTLSETRRTLGRADAVVHRQGAYSLGPSLDLAVDVDELLARVEAARESSAEAALDHLRAAWSLYRGPLLDGFEDEWIQEPRERLRRTYIDLLRRLGERADELGRTSLALDAYRALLLTESFDEEAHVAVMDIYGRSGRRDLVRRQFVHLQDRLKELRVEPSQEALAAYNRWMG